MRVAPPPETRRGDAGLTLIEMLVVLAILGILAGAVGLRMGPRGAGSALEREAELLATRLETAAEDALLTGRSSALIWTDTGYGFRAWSDGQWGPHPLPALPSAHALAAAVRHPAARAEPVVIGPDLLPAGGRTLEIRLEAADGTRVVVFDGVTAEATQDRSRPGAISATDMSRGSTLATDPSRAAVLR